MASRCQKYSLSYSRYVLVTTGTAVETLEGVRGAQRVGVGVELGLDALTELNVGALLVFDAESVCNLDEVRLSFGHQGA